MADHIDTALRGYTDRIVRLHEERDALNSDIREVYGEAKEAGFDVTTVREVVRELRMEPDARNSRYQLLDQYRHALGMLADLPLGEAAIDAAASRPRPFAEQPVKRGRGRPRKDSVGDAIAAARAHLGDAGGAPAGTA